MSVLLAILWALALAVLAVALAALGLALAVLALPLHLRVQGEVRDGEPAGLVRAAWAFGVVAGELGPQGLAVKVLGVRVWRRSLRDLLRRGERSRRPGTPRAARERREGSGRGKLAAFREHRATLLRMARRLAGTLHLALRVRGTIGLQDPADTARLAQVLRTLAELPGVELELELDWLDENLEGEAVGSARVWLPETLAVAVALLFERGSWKAVRALAGGADRGRPHPVVGVEAIHRR